MVIAITRICGDCQHEGPFSIGEQESVEYESRFKYAPACRVCGSHDIWIEVRIGATRESLTSSQQAMMQEADQTRRY